MSHLEEEHSLLQEDEAKLECVRLANELISGLGLNIPQYTDIKEIEVPHLVEINCRLLNISFEDFEDTESNGFPWKPIDDIILSLKQKFGLRSKIEHLEPMLIFSKDPVHLGCLLQIFLVTFHFYMARGRTFNEVLHNDKTVLTTSYDESEGESSKTELDLNIELIQNETGNEKVEINQWAQDNNKYKIQVNIPKLNDTLPPHKTPIKLKENSIKKTEKNVPPKSEESLRIKENKSPITPQNRPISPYRIKDSIFISKNVNNSKVEPATLTSNKLLKKGTDNNTLTLTNSKSDSVSQSEQIKKSCDPDPISQKNISQNKCSTQVKHTEVKLKKPRNLSELDGTDGKYPTGRDLENKTVEELKAFDKLLKNKIKNLKKSLSARDKKDLEDKEKVRKIKSGKHHKSKFTFRGREIKDKFPYYPYGYIRPRCKIQELNLGVKEPVWNKFNLKPLPPPSDDNDK